MNNVEELLKKIHEDLYKLTQEEQNEFVLTIMKGIQAKRRLDMQDLEDKKLELQGIFDKLKEEACQASNIVKS